MLKDIYITFHDPIWTVALFIALYFPLKKILLNLYLRKHFKEKGEPDEVVKKKLNNWRSTQTKSVKKRPK